MPTCIKVTTDHNYDPTYTYVVRPLNRTQPIFTYPADAKEHIEFFQKNFKVFSELFDIYAVKRNSKIFNWKVRFGLESTTSMSEEGLFREAIIQAVKEAPVDELQKIFKLDITRPYPVNPTETITPQMKKLQSKMETIFDIGYEVLE